MAGILTDMESAETFKAYESYLLGQPAKAGTVLRQGAFFYICLLYTSPSPRD